MSKIVWLKTEQDFSAFRKSKAYQSRLLGIRAHFAANQNFPRFGFIVPKKVLPKAAHRNLIKRRIKAILQKVHRRLKPVDLLFFPRAQAIKVKFSELESIIMKLLSDANLWKS